MEAKLVILGGKTNKQHVKLKLPTVIGRSRQADLTVAHPMISRRHCELFEADGLVKIKDLGSLNGTYVHGKRIDQEVILRPNDEFTIGPLTFRIEYEAPEGIPEAPLTPVEETPEYIPSFVQGAPEAATGSPAADLGESAGRESGLAEAPPSLPPTSEASSPWENLETLEKEFAFDLAEEVPSETPPETQEAPGLAEEKALEQLAEEALGDDLPETEPPLAEEALPEGAAPPEAPPETELTPPKDSAPAEAAPPISTEEEARDDLDAIEDAALRDFLKGLR